MKLYLWLLVWLVCTLLLLPCGLWRNFNIRHFGVCVSDIFLKVSISFLAVTVYWLLISLSYRVVLTICFFGSKTRQNNCCTAPYPLSQKTSTVQMHHMDTDKPHWKKVWWELHQSSMSNIEQILGATSHETIAVQLLTSHLKNHSSKTNKTCGTLLERQGRTHKRRSSLDPYSWT